MSNDLKTTLKFIIPVVALCFWIAVPKDPPPSPANSTLPPVPLGIHRTKISAPCAVDRTARNNMIQAIRDGDQEAIDGLVERKQAFILTEGTRFEVSSSEPGGIAWGFVRSGRYSGEDCYILGAVVR